MGTGLYMPRPMLLLTGIIAVGSVPATIELRLLPAIRTPLFLLRRFDGLLSLHFTLFPRVVDCTRLLQLQTILHLAEY